MTLLNRAEDPSNFIRLFLIRNINKLVDRKRYLLDISHCQFIYFDNKHDIMTKKIDRFGANNIYLEDEVLPVSWYSLPGKTLFNIWRDVKDNNFYVLKELEDGRSYKVRLKKNSKPIIE
jgi:hypothetical protein